MDEHTKESGMSRRIMDGLVEWHERERVERSVAMSDWISVKDRLPEETGLYLAVLGDDDVDTAHFGKRNLRWFCDSAFELPLDCVTHWQPLPAPPQFDEADHADPEVGVGPCD